jgi:ADP-heptose:LPS heptosyltransferase
LERTRWLIHAEFFVGLSGGLSWLAWAVGVPVVMISGWNDPQYRFDHRGFLWCPRHAGTPRQFECARLTAARQVIDTLRRLSGFLPRNSTSRL